jgi:hypothetical protein
MTIKKTLALEARFTSGTPVGSGPIESRFQRLFSWRFEFLGRCPRLDIEIAPLALRAATGFLKMHQAKTSIRLSLAKVILTVLL